MHVLTIVDGIKLSCVVRSPPGSPEKIIGSPEKIICSEQDVRESQTILELQSVLGTKCSEFDWQF